jgi:hypothetical protein
MFNRVPGGPRHAGRCPAVLTRRTLGRVFTIALSTNTDVFEHDTWNHSGSSAPKAAFPHSGKVAFFCGFHRGRLTALKSRGRKRRSLQSMRPV